MKKFPHITAAVLTNTSKPLEIIKNIIIPHLRPDQILVKIFYSGVCHSQLMEVKGLRGSDIWLPHMLGHEATAEIIQIGSDVKKVKKGDKVILSWIKGEGKDLGGTKFSTTNGKTINAGSVTTFSNYSVVSENRVSKLPNNVPLDVGILLGCALPTGAGIIKNEIKINSENSLAIIGLGGIGLCSLISAIDLNPKTLVCIDTNVAKLNFAKKLGVNSVINPHDKNFFEIVKKITNGKGFDYVVESAGLTETIELGFKIIKQKGGECIFGSHPKFGDKIKLDPFELISGKNIRGSWGGASNLDRDISYLSNLIIKNYCITKKIISPPYSLEDINQALKDLEEKKINRAIIKMKH